MTLVKKVASQRAEPLVIILVLLMCDRVEVSINVVKFNHTHEHVYK